MWARLTSPRARPPAQDGRPLSQDHYWGLYIAGEAVARGKKRVDVAKFDPARPSGRPGAGLDFLGRG
jgi:hypothetical protein